MNEIKNIYGNKSAVSRLRIIVVQDLRNNKYSFRPFKIGSIVLVSKVKSFTPVFAKKLQTTFCNKKYDVKSFKNSELYYRRVSINKSILILQVSRISPREIRKKHLHYFNAY